MKDARGYYYYPNPVLKTTRMYVQRAEGRPDGDIQFRLYSDENPEIWERHGWLSLDVLRQAAALYEGQANPLALYDANVAAALLKDAAHEPR